MIVHDLQNPALNRDLSAMKYNYTVITDLASMEHPFSLTKLKKYTPLHWQASNRHLFFNVNANFTQSCHHWLVIQSYHHTHQTDVIAVNSGVITVIIGDLRMTSWKYSFDSSVRSCINFLKNLKICQNTVKGYWIMKKNGCKDFF